MFPSNFTDSRVEEFVATVTENFLKRRQGTPPTIIYDALKWMRNQHRIVRDMMESGIIHLVHGTYFPGFRGVDMLMTSLRSDARGATDLVFRAIRKLAGRSAHQKRFYFDEVLTEAKTLDSSLTAEATNFGLFMGRDFPLLFNDTLFDKLPFGNGSCVLWVEVKPHFQFFESLEIAWHEQRTYGTSKAKQVPQENPSRLDMEDFSFVQDPRLRQIIQRDYSDFVKAQVAKIFKPSLVLLGGILEALLFDALKQNEAKALAASKAEKRAVEDWRLETLIEVAVEISLVSEGVRGIGHSVREFRNLVHPGRERRGDYVMSDLEVEVTEKILRIVIRDLKERTKRTTP